MPNCLSISPINQSKAAFSAHLKAFTAINISFFEPYGSLCDPGAFYGAEGNANGSWQARS
jgi:hypothetical protein